MKIAAAKAIAELISDEELSEDNIIPKAFDKRVGPAVAKAVAEAARKTGVARKQDCESAQHGTIRMYPRKKADKKVDKKERRHEDGQLGKHGSEKGDH